MIVINNSTFKSLHQMSNRSSSPVLERKTNDNNNNNNKVFNIYVQILQKLRCTAQIFGNIESDYMNAD